MKPTLQQIAADCGLSLSTVSRAITGKGYVSEQAQELIDESVARLNYVKRERKNIALHDTDSLTMILVGGIKTSLASTMVEELILELAQKQKHAFVAITEFLPEKELEYLSYAAENHFFGVLALSLTETPDNLSYLRNYPIPITMVDRYLPSMETDYLCPDFYRMGYTSAEYLVQHGHTKIAFIGGAMTSSITEDKLQGFQDCIHSHGLEIRPEWCIHLHRLIYENGATVVAQLLSMGERPTAIVVSNDISVGILNALILQGIRVPEDISLFACEDSPLIANCLVPMTCMGLKMEQIAHDAVKTLIRRRRQPYAPRQCLIYNPHLVERKSVITIP